MNTVKILVIAVLISGGLCGMAGFMQSSAVEKSITDSMSAGLGFTAVITAWLAKLKPPVIVGCVVYVLDTSPERKLASGNENTLVHYRNNAGCHNILRSCVRVLYKL